MQDEIGFMSATEMLARFKARSLSPVEVMTAILARVDALQPQLNAFVLVDAEQAMAGARASEERWQKEAPLGRLDGVPVSVKDLLLTRGWPTRRGSRTIDPDQPWTEDAPVVARLREHGAIPFGKTTTPEFGWKGLDESPLSGTTANPWDLSRTPGGSSGGAAAQVAAGLGPLALGTDGAGSIRIPAAFCGIFGHKPSFGRVPAWPASPFSTVAHVGPMTRSVADAALMLTVLAEPDWRDWYALPPAGADYSDGLEGGLAGLRIAWSADLGYAAVDPEVAAATAEAVTAFSELGAVVEAADPGFDSPQEPFWTHWLLGCRNLLRTLTPAQREMLDPGLHHCFEDSLDITVDQMLDGQNARVALGLAMNRFHRQYDLLVTPSLAVPAFPLGRLDPDGREDRNWLGWTPFSYPFNFTQQPAATVPCGFTASGLPIGLQIVGPMHDDALVLRAARAFEQARPWDGKRPAL